MFILERSYGITIFQTKRFGLELFQSKHVVLEPYQMQNDNYWRINNEQQSPT